MDKTDSNTQARRAAAENRDNVSNPDTVPSRRPA
jgi:hypothetical protein